MNDLYLDARIIAAAKRGSGHTNTFTKAVMQKVRVLHAADSLANQPRPAQPFLSFTHKLAYGFAVVLVASAFAFTGYAYAIGSDPITLIKRWVEGDKVNIEYEGRTFAHGTDRRYSDAAITAYAEVNTVTDLWFRAASKLQIPKDGIEYVGLPPRMDPARAYQYPYLATVKAVTADSVTLHKQYLWGDKMTPSKDLDESLTLPLKDFHFFTKGEPVTGDPAMVGNLVMVFTDTSIRHEIATNKSTKAVNYFVFTLSHELSAFKEASLTTSPTPDPKQFALYEASWGELSDVCLNNGADTCDLKNFSKSANDGLFVLQRGASGMNTYNPAASSYFNTESGDDSDMISRNIMGQLAAIDDHTITVRTSSGAEWKLMYNKAQQKAFENHYKRGLRVGDRLAGQVLQSIHDLNSRTVELKNIASLGRYQ